jgi:hypothetical protein
MATSLVGRAGRRLPPCRAFTSSVVVPTPAFMEFYKIVRTRQSGWRLKSRLNDRAALRHEVRLRGLPRMHPTALVGGRVSATRDGGFRGRRPKRRGFNRPRSAARCPL